MTRVCAWCKTEQGEKCPKCGGSVSFLRGVFYCVADRLRFRKGDGGETHGVCSECLANLKTQIMSRGNCVNSAV